MVFVIEPIAAIPVILLWLMIFRAQLRINPAVDHVSKVSSQKKGTMIEVLSNLIEGASIYRSYQSEGLILNRLKDKITDWISVECFQWRLITWSWSWMWLLAELAIVFVLFSAAWAFREGHISKPIAGMILIAVAQQQNIIGWTLDCIGAFLTGRAKALRFLSLGDLPNEGF